MSTNAPSLLKDRDGAGIQTLIPDETSVSQVAFGAANSAAVLPAGSQIVEVTSSDFCRFAFGDASVDATQGTVRIIGPGSRVYRVPPGATDFAATQLGSNPGFVTVTRLY